MPLRTASLFLYCLATPVIADDPKARDLVSYFVGQGVGLVDSVKSAGAVVQEFKEDFVEAIEHMNALVDE